MSSDQLGQSPASLSTDSDPSTTPAADTAAAPAKRVRKTPVRKPKADAAAPVAEVLAETAPEVIEAPAAEAAADVAAAAPPRTRKTLVRKPKAVDAVPESPQLSLTIDAAPAPAGPRGWRPPFDEHEQDPARMRAYIDWELALLDRVAQDGTLSFGALPPGTEAEDPAG